MENLTIRLKVLREKYLKNTLSNQFLKVNNCLLELENDFIEQNDIELKDRERKIRREIGKLFFKPNNITVDDMDRYKKIEMKKLRLIENTWYGWLINYLFEPIRKSISTLKGKLEVFISQLRLNRLVIGETKK